MASRQEKEQRKETEASDLSDVKRRDKEWERHEERPGVVGSVIKAVQSAKEAVVGKTNDEHGTRNEDVEDTTESAARTLDEKAREMKENAKDAANEIKGYAAEKVREASERTKQMVEFTKGKTKDTAQSATEGKIVETSQLAADKTKDTAQSAAGKLGELKDKAMGLLSGKKEEAKERMYESAGTAKEKLREVQEEARQREEEMGLTDRRVLDDKNEEKEDRGGLILGALGALKDKLTTHTSNGDKSRRSMDTSRVAGRNEGEKKAQRTSGEKVAEVHLGDTSPGAIASALKASDQMNRQTFNEVGRINDEGVVHIVRRDLQGKM